MPPRSLLRALVCLTALLTAFALVELSRVLASPPPSGDGGEADGGAVVREFYAAVNTALRDGRAPVFDRLLAPGFVDHGVPPGEDPTVTGLGRRVLALHRTSPALRLSVGSLLEDGGFVVASVRVDGPTPATYLGLSLTQPPPVWGGRDIFRIGDGAIVERWGSLNHALTLDPAQWIPLDPPGTSLVIPALARRRMEPGSAIPLGSLSGPEAIFLETGRMTLSVDPQAARPAQLWPAPGADGAGQPVGVGPGETVTVEPGQLLVLPMGTTATAQANHDATGVLHLALRRPGGSRDPASTASSPTPAEDSATSDLGGHSPVTLVAGALHLGLGRALLAPGAAVSFEAPRSAVLVAIERGHLTVTAGVGNAWSWHDRDGSLSTERDPC